jgi:hypothetical protein
MYDVNLLIAFPGLAIIAVVVPALALRWFLAPEDRRRTEFMFLAASLVEPMSIAAQMMANAMSPLRPFKYDLYVYQFDRLFGSPSFRLGQIVWTHLWLHNLVSISYGMLPVAMLFAFAVTLYFRSEREAVKVAASFAVFFFGGTLLYLVCPVSGPVYAFPSFPAWPINVTAHPLALVAPPNAVPSGHTGAALLCLCFLWRWNWGKVTGIVFLILTVIATLGSGQHYLFDLLCAVPYSALVLIGVNRYAMPHLQR